ncbi:TRAP transporter small permease subunit [Halomonas sp. 18H]|uniref:TRAP transporter small permease subunit n=1 Tax=Halomonas almeriensis TaxID=308163 RepID=UPI002232B9E1|nr:MULTISPECIES: TRAP transporter small permease subunit [Halomonas]MCW4153809.1 TRAP transporter small permease subunit [Halomonas sp. 18H]MDN3553154.1 TRAP transporter small permease subunit [Halomonas almeriensis]
MKAPDRKPQEDRARTTAEAERIAEEVLHHHTELPQTRISRVLDSAMTAIGKSASWLWLVTVAVIIWAVVGRYAFDQGSVTLEEWQWHIAGAAWLLGLSYTLTTDDHVRVDVIHERLSLKAQGRIELAGILVLLLPFLAISLYELVPYASSSFQQGETSQSPAGLSHRWVLKAVVALSFALLILAALSRLLRVTALLFGFPRPLAADTTKGDES